MRVVVAGGTGFLGRALSASLRADGHAVTVLSRRAEPGQADVVAWMPNGTVGPWASALASADAVVNLAGEGIADKRWTTARKAVLVESRLRATSSLASAIASLSAPPRTFLSGSGVGYYGPHGDEIVSEEMGAGGDFLAQLAADWEAAALAAQRQTRVVLLRTGLVLGHEGALAKMLLPFKLGVGGRLGNGQQWMPWIHVDDWVRMVRHLIDDTRAAGAFNLAGPVPVTNAEFTRSLGRAVHRPTLFPVPGFALRVALGELADVLLTGQRAMPAKATALGFTFTHGNVQSALDAIVAR